MKNHRSPLILFAFLVACSQPEVQSAPTAEPTPPKAPVVEAPVVTAPKPVAPPVAPTVSAPKITLPAAAAVKTGPPKPTLNTVSEGTWTLKKGKLSGPEALVAPKLIFKVKNEKTPGHTSMVCFNYGSFAVIETKSTDEVGSAEVYVRFASPEHKGICQEDYKGQSVNLKIIEGSFAGVAGDYVLIDGADASEGLLEFQFLSLETGKQVYKSYHHPTEEFSISKSGGKTSVSFFASAKVKCELAGEDPAGCWKKILQFNGIKKATPMPDCQTVFTKTNTPMTELALVTVPAKIADLSKPTLAFVGGKSTCAPAP